eukprot:PITA_06317
MAFPISAAELRYQSIVNSVDDHSTPFSEEELDGDVALAWSLDSTSALDCLDSVLPSEEVILEAMMGIDRPWEDLHHRSYFLPPLQESLWIKKQEKIEYCIVLGLNRLVPKDNTPTPFIDQIIDECASNEIFSFMDGFSGYNQISIHPEDQHKITFICPWGTFAYRKMHFGPKNARATFQRAMSYAFHDIKHVIEAYLDDLAARS